MSERLRKFLSVRTEDESAKVDLLRSGLVRLTVNDDPKSRLEADTLEDLMTLAAAHPKLSNSLYEALLWELDMLGLRGE